MRAWLAIIVAGVVGCAGSATSTVVPAPASATSPVPTAATHPAATSPPKAAPTQAPATRKPTRERVTIPGTELVRGRSRVLVNAPIARVRRVVLKFNKYAEFMPHYRVSRVLGRGKDGYRTVFMQVAALKGLLKMGAQIEIGRQELRDGEEVYESRFLKGNVKDFKAIWRLRKIDAAKTELSLEVFLHPKIPLPNSIINGENLDGAMKGVLAMRDRIESTR